MEKVIKELLTLIFLTFGVVWFLFIPVFFFQYYALHGISSGQLLNEYGLMLIGFFIMSIIFIILSIKLNRNK